MKGHSKDWNLMIFRRNVWYQLVFKYCGSSTTFLPFLMENKKIKLVGEASVRTARASVPSQVSVKMTMLLSKIRSLKIKVLFQKSNHINGLIWEVKKEVRLKISIKSLFVSSKCSQVVLLVPTWMITLVMEGGEDCSRPGSLSKKTGTVAPGKQYVRTLKYLMILIMESPMMTVVGLRSRWGGRRRRDWTVGGRWGCGPGWGPGQGKVLLQRDQTWERDTLMAPCCKSHWSTESLLFSF